MPKSKIKGYTWIEIKDSTSGRKETGILFHFKNQILIQSLQSKKSRVINISLKKKNVFALNNSFFFWKFKGTTL